jgi:hypothetical protein
MPRKEHEECIGKADQDETVISHSIAGINIFKIPYLSVSFPMMGLVSTIVTEDTIKYRPMFFETPCFPAKTMRKEPVTLKVMSRKSITTPGSSASFEITLLRDILNLLVFLKLV